MMTTLASDWLRHFILFLCNSEHYLMKLNWQEVRTQFPLKSLCFSGRSANKGGWYSDTIYIHVNMYRISGIFGVGLIFAEFAASLKSPKIDTAKIKPYYTSSLRILEIAKIGLSENLAHLPSVIFAKIFRGEKFPIYGILQVTIDFQNLMQNIMQITIKHTMNIGGITNLMESK